MKSREAPQKPAAEPTLLLVGIYEARSNKMFTEDQRKMVRFLRYNQAVRCAECGRRSKTHWTVLYSFEAQSLGHLVPKRSGKVHRPLDPVCRAHVLAMANWMPLPAARKGNAKESNTESMW